MQKERATFFTFFGIAITMLFITVYVIFEHHINVALLPNNPAALEAFMYRELTPSELPNLHPDMLEHFVAVLGFVQTVDVLNDIDPSTCHDAAHIIGDLAYKEAGSIPGSFNLCTEKCMSGCIHGALLASVNESVDYSSGQHEHVSLADFATEIEEICTVETSDPTLEGTCIHGVGHALMSLSIRVEDGLALCSEYADPRKRYYCETGVFMETLLGGSTRYASSTNPLYPCDTFGTHPSACMRYQTDIIMRTHEPDIVDFCKNISDDRMQSACFHGLGRTIALGVYDGTESITTCFESEFTDGRISCVEAVAEILHEYDHDVGNAACAEVAEEPAVEEVCRTAVRDGLYSLEKDFTPYIGVMTTQP